MTSALPFARVPMDPVIDFGRIIADAKLPGVLDPSSIRVENVATRELVPHLIEGFATSNSGRVEWVITDPQHRRYDIRFQTVRERPALTPPGYVPLIGTGDLLRYNAGEGRPFCITRSMAGLVDMNGDGKRDLLGT